MIAENNQWDTYIPWTHLLLLTLFIFCGSPYADEPINQPINQPINSLENLKSSFIITGRVISLTGLPIQGAEISSSANQTVSNLEGWFEIPAPSSAAQWVTVKHADYISRTRAAQPGESVLFRLTPDDGETVAIHFGGDTMFGRRYYDPDRDGNREDALLPLNPSAEDHLALLKGIRPWLENAHVTVLNLETPLTEIPYHDLTQPRADAFHPYKAYTFASHLNVAPALKKAGVDLVDVGNNHVYDMTESGLQSTTKALNDAGLLHFGSGTKEAEAWQPAVTTVAGQTLAFIGCSVIGHTYGLSVFVSDEENKGGAAFCEEERIRQAVTEAKAQYDNVIVMIHNGKEYLRHPIDSLIQLTTAAREAGATLVINHTPHVVSGFDWDGQSFVAWSLGNFVFDQNFWATFQTYMLAVHVRKGEVVRAYVEPMMIEGYRPKAVSGGFADYLAREAAGREIGPFVVENGAMETDVNHLATRQSIMVSFDSGNFPGKVLQLRRSQWISEITGLGFIRLGRDLLWTGSMERHTVDESSQEPALWRLTVGEKPETGPLWRLPGVEMLVGPEYAHSGERGVRLQRNATDTSSIMLTVVDRVQLPPDAGQISVMGWLRASENAKVTLKIYWYDTRSTKAGSMNRQVKELTVSASQTWTPFQAHLPVLPGAIAVKPFFRLARPETETVSVDFDDLRLVAWAPTTNIYSPLYDHVWTVGPVDLKISQDILPGAEDWNIMKNVLFQNW